MNHRDRDKFAPEPVRATSAAAILASACERLAGRGLGRDGGETLGPVLDVRGCGDTPQVTTNVAEEVAS